MMCVIKDVRTDHPPTVPVCLFDGTEVTLNNLFIIFTPVHITILFIMAANDLTFVVPPSPARNPVDQSLTWNDFGTEGNHNIIRNEV